MFESSPLGLSISNLTGHTDILRTVEILSDGNIASGSNDNTIRVWSSETFAVKQVISVTPYPAHILSITSLDGFFAEGDGSGNINCYNYTTYAPVLPTANPGNSYIRSLLKIGDNYLAAGSYGSRITIYDLSLWTVYKILTGHGGAVNGLKILSNGYFISCSDDRTLIVWNPTSWTQVFVMRGHTAALRSVTQLKSGLILSSSDDCTVKVWNFNSWTLNTTLIGHTASVTSVIQLTNGYIASGSSDMTIKIWNSLAFNLYYTINTGQPGIVSIRQLPSGFIVSGGSDHQLKVWGLNF